MATHFAKRLRVVKWREAAQRRPVSKEVDVNWTDHVSIPGPSLITQILLGGWELESSK